MEAPVSPSASISATVTIQPLCSTIAIPETTRHITAAHSSQRSCIRSRPEACRWRAKSTTTASGSDSRVSTRPTVSRWTKRSPGIGTSGAPVSIGSWNSSALSAEVGAKSSSTGRAHAITMTTTLTTRQRPAISRPVG